VRPSTWPSQEPWEPSQTLMHKVGFGIAAMPYDNAKTALAPRGRQPADLGGRGALGAADRGHGVRRLHPLAVNSPLFYVHAELQPGARRGVPAEHTEKAAYVAWARVEVDGQGCRLDQTMVFVLPAVAHWLAPVREAEEPNP
jgi:hypothetical protein